MSDKTTKILQLDMEGLELELGPKVTFLVKLKEKKIAAADRQRKLLIKSANQLYDYEAAEIENLYNVRLVFDVYLVAFSILSTFFRKRCMILKMTFRKKN